MAFLFDGRSNMELWTSRLSCSFAPTGLIGSAFYPQLRPWAAFLCRFAAKLEVPEEPSCSALLPLAVELPAAKGSFVVEWRPFPGGQRWRDLQAAPR